MEASAYVQLADVEQWHWWYVARRNIIEGVLLGLALPPDIRILEVGCGTGGNLALLQNFGRLSAMEMDRGACARAKTAPGGANADIREGRLPGQNPFRGQKFDLIVLFDVLEHIEEDQEALDEVFDCIAPVGKLIITVPAYQWLFGRHDVLLHHKRRYLKEEVVARASQAGFAMRKATYFNTLLFPLVAATRLWEKVSPANTAAGQKTPPPPVNAILKWVFASERPVVTRASLPFGLSILYVGEKAPTG